MSSHGGEDREDSEAGVKEVEEICVQLDLFTDHLMVPPCSGPGPDRPVAAPFMINANVLANVHNNIDIYHAAALLSSFLPLTLISSFNV